MTMHATNPTTRTPRPFTLLRTIRTHECTEADKLIQIHAGPDGHGGAPHNYQITYPVLNSLGQTLGHGSTNFIFQRGPICEAGLNGITIESLLAIAADRLDRFQQGSHPCDENEQARHYILDAMKCLHARTRRRQREHAEGTSAPDAPGGVVSAQPSPRSSELVRALKCLRSILCDPCGNPVFVGSDGDREIAAKAFAVLAEHEGGDSC